MENTVVGVYDSYTQAQNVVNELQACGFSRSDIQLSPETAPTTGQAATSDQQSSSGISNFFRSLFGMNEDADTGTYSEAVQRGHCVVTVNAPSDEMRERAADVMNRFSPIDIDERASQWRSEGWTGYAQPSAGQQAEAGATTQGTTTEEARIPIVEEELRVGKRAVQRGGVRIYQRVTETPVQESVNLRQEQVTVERQPVDQPATEADMAAFKEGTVELREMAEEPVVAKTAHVVEEVVVGKEVTQETADIKDTVRKTEVDVEQLGPEDKAQAATTATRTDYADTTMTADDADYRTHWQTAYSTSGGRYEDYDAAYRYGSTMAGSERFKNYRWEDVEPDIRSDWERSHPESTWEKVKDAVRYGAERVTGRRQ